MWLLGSLRPLFFSALCSLVFISATCSENNITQKDLECKSVTEANAMSCCLQLMSSKTGSDSKDAVCIKLVEEKAAELQQRRNTQLFDYCKSQESFTSCWDKIK